MLRKIIKILMQKFQSQMSKWNNFKFHLLLWVAGINGKGVNTCKGCPIVDIKEGAKVEFGENIWLNNYHNTAWYTRCMIHVGSNAHLRIGDNTGRNGVLLFCNESISIGSHVLIGGGTRIYDTNFHELDWRIRRDPSQKGEVKTAPVVIGDDTFVGTGCIIGKGVHIGERSIIAAGSVVVKDIPSDCIAGGNPCKVIKMLA